jgi:hypothetical protein
MSPFRHRPAPPSGVILLTQITIAGAGEEHMGAAKRRVGSALILCPFAVHQYNGIHAEDES